MKTVACDDGPACISLSHHGYYTVRSYIVVLCGWQKTKAGARAGPIFEPHNPLSNAGFTKGCFDCGAH